MYIFRLRCWCFSSLIPPQTPICSPGFSFSCGFVWTGSSGAGKGEWRKPFQGEDVAPCFMPTIGLLPRSNDGISKFSRHFFVLCIREYYVWNTMPAPRPETQQALFPPRVSACTSIHDCLQLDDRLQNAVHAYYFISFTPGNFSRDSHWFGHGAVL